MINTIKEALGLLLKLALVTGCGVVVLGVVAMVVAWWSRPDR